MKETIEIANQLNQLIDKYFKLFIAAIEQSDEQQSKQWLNHMEVMLPALNWTEEFRTQTTASCDLIAEARQQLYNFKLNKIDEILCAVSC